MSELGSEANQKDVRGIQLMLRPLITIGCMTFAGTVCAEPVPLTSETIKETLSGSVLEMDTPLGTKIPIRFSKNGLVSGEAGILSGMLGAEKDRGRWWTRNDELCVKWFRWFEAKQKCAALSLDGTRIYWRERGGESGTATLAERPQPAPTTVARVEPNPEPAPQPQKKPELQQAAVPQPEPQVESNDIASLIKQRSVTTEPLAEERPALMFAGMTGLQDIAIFNRKKPEPQPEAAPASEAPRRVAALPEPQATASVAEPQNEPRAEQQITAATPPPAATEEPRESVSIVDIDAMGTEPRSSEPLRSESVRQVSFRVAGVRAGDMLNVRSGPSESHEPIGRIPPAARGVKIVGQCRGEWCPIRRGRLKGWVNSYYLAEEASAAR